MWSPRCLATPLIRYLGAIAIVVAILVVVAATARTPLLPLLPGAVRVPTNDHDPGLGVTVLCTLGRASPSVSGRLAGESAAADGFPVWLEDAGDSRIIVFWPRGFSARLEPVVELIDWSNQVIARGGDVVDLNLHPSEAAGTPEDPYVPIWVNGVCYAPRH